MTPAQIQMKKNAFDRLNRSEHNAFRFTRAENHFKELRSKKEDIINKNEGNPPSIFWICMSAMGLLAAIFFGIFAANNAQETIRSFIDPLNSGSVRKEIIYLIGAGISIIGMILGDGLVDNKPFTINPSMDRTLNKNFVISLIGSLIYILFQAAVTLFARPKGSDYSLTFVTVGIAFFEILIGMYILPRALLCLNWLITNLRQQETTRQLDTFSRSTHENYRYYINSLETYNQAYPKEVLQREGNENMRRAIAYYSGIKLPQDNGNMEVENRGDDSKNHHNENPETARKKEVADSESRTPRDVPDDVDRDLDNLLNSKKIDNDLVV
jgi:hypothetical protein